jgi:hypothetical protein
MDEIISYKMCAVKVRNAKLRNYLNTFCHISETQCSIDLHVNALSSAGSAAPNTLLFLQRAKIRF